MTNEPTLYCYRNAKVCRTNRVEPRTAILQLTVLQELNHALYEPIRYISVQFVRLKLQEPIFNIATRRPTVSSLQDL